MFGRFTDRSRKVLQLASQEAQQLRCNYIGSEHILLGIAREGGGVAAHVLKNLGVELQQIIGEVERLTQTSDQRSHAKHLPLNTDFKNAIEHALVEAMNLKHDFVGTEHLLLGLVHDNAGLSAVVLRNLGLCPEVVREETLRFLGHAEDHQ